jgi:hypothetical protein
MADTIREKIMDNIKTVLTAMTIANGYENDIGSVQRWRQHGNNKVTMPLIVIVEGSESNEDDAYPLTTCKLDVGIVLFVREAETSVVDTGQALNSLLGDIKKALKADITRGGNAVDTQVRSIQPFENDEGQIEAGLIIEIAILYRHQQTDPTVGL